MIRKTMDLNCSRSCVARIASSGGKSVMTVRFSLLTSNHAANKGVGIVMAAASNNHNRHVVARRFEHACFAVKDSCRPFLFDENAARMMGGLFLEAQKP